MSTHGRRTGGALKRVIISLLVLVALAAAGLAVYAYWIMPAEEIPGARREDAPFGYDEAFDQKRTSPKGTEYTLNNGTATFDLDVAEADAHCGQLFADYAAALAYCRRNGLTVVPSVQMVQGKLKQFDDGLCAALELALQDGKSGDGRLGKAAALRRLLDRLLARLEGASGTSKDAIEAEIVHVAAALRAGGEEVSLDSPLAARVAEALRRFDAQPMASRPIGFWTWSEPLKRLYRQDRFLSLGMPLARELPVCIALSETVEADPALAEAFGRFRAAAAALTNPPVYVDPSVNWAPPAKCPSFREICAAFPDGVPDAAALADARKTAAERFGGDAGFALVSYASSKEYSLLSKLKADFADDTMQLIVDAVRSGRLRLEPEADSGWYDYQWHALETLLLPDRARESVKLFLSDSYRKRLEEAFKTSLTKHRETHIKALPVIYIGTTLGSPEPVEIGPEFSVEPMATVYLRYGQAYRFLRNALHAAAGRAWLATLHRANEGEPPVAEDLDAELRRMALLCYGLYERLSVEVGLLPEYLPDEITEADIAAARAEAQRWLASPANDADLVRDTRVAVPILTDPYIQQTRYWATAGVKLQRVVYTYREEPAVRGWVEAEFVPTHYYLPTDVFVEFDRSGVAPLTRQEYRALCDGCEDEASLRRTLGAIGRTAAAAAPSAPGWIWWTGGGLLVLAALFLIRRKVPRVWWRRGWRIFWAATALTALVFGLLVGFEPGCQVWFLVKFIAPINDQLGLMVEGWVWRDASPRRVAALVDMLSDGDPQTRYYAARFLEYTGIFDENRDRLLAECPDCRRRVQAAADDEVVAVAAKAVRILGDLPSQETTAFLVDKLRRSRHVDLLCVNAITALGQMKRPEALEAILPFTHDPRGAVCHSAALAAARYDDPRVPPRLLELLADPDVSASHAGCGGIDRFRYYCKDTAGRWAERFDRGLLAAAKRPELPPGCRLEAAREIEDTPLCVEALLSVLATRQYADYRAESMAYWRGEAADELGDFGRDAAAALDELSKAAGEPIRELRKSAEYAIQHIREAMTRPSGPPPPAPTRPAR